METTRIVKLFNELVVLEPCVMIVGCLDAGEKAVLMFISVQDDANSYLLNSLCQGLTSWQGCCARQEQPAQGESEPPSDNYQG